MNYSPLAKVLYLPVVFICLPAVAGALEIDDLQHLNDLVNHSVTYLGYPGWDFRDLGDHGQGNCAAIAYTKWKRLQEASYGDRAAIRTCKIKTGEAHAFVVVDGYVLDNVDENVRAVEDDGCISGAINVNLDSLRQWVAGHADTGPLPEVAKKALSGSGQ